MSFRMTPSPDQMSDETINALVDRGFLEDPANAKPAPANEHELATFLYRRFRPGSGMLTKLDAYKIGNELDRLLAVEREYDRLRAAIAKDERGPERTELVGLGHPEEQPTCLPVPYNYDDETDGL